MSRIVVSITLDDELPENAFVFDLEGREMTLREEAEFAFEHAWDRVQKKLDESEGV